MNRSQTTIAAKGNESVTNAANKPPRITTNSVNRHKRATNSALLNEPTSQPYKVEMQERSTGRRALLASGTKLE
jgi:hypothetical protein